MPVKPMLGGIELQQVQKIDTDEDQVLTQHSVPALEGDFLQGLGRRAIRVTLVGVMSGADAAASLKTLRDKYRAGEVVSFVADIATATKVDQVLIEEFGVRELAGKPARFEYELTLREFIPPPPPDSEEPPVTPETPVPVDPNSGKLVVEVIVEGEPGFDFSTVTVTAQEDGTSGPRVLAKRENNFWTEDPMPPGQYTVRAVVTEPEAMSGEGQATVRRGQTEQVQITLRRGVNIAKAFIIHFRFDSAFFEPCMREVLERVFKYAQAHPAEKIVVVGHTDRQGPRDYNQQLSERRARSVFAFLTFGASQALRDSAVTDWDQLWRPGHSGLHDEWSVREQQYMLQDLEFYSGNIKEDPNEDPKTPAAKAAAAKTAAAVRAFQGDHGLPQTGIVDAATWKELVKAYLEAGALAIPEDRFLPNADPERNCDGGKLRWLGCGEDDPVLWTEDAWRPNRRVEILFTREDKLPCEEPAPVTLKQPPETAAGNTWCLDNGKTTYRCCFIKPRTQGAIEAGRKPASFQWTVQPAEPDRVVVSGTVLFDDGAPYANKQYVLIAPDGQYLRNATGPDPAEVRKGATGVRGTAVPMKTDALGNFDHPNQTPVGIYILELRKLEEPAVARANEEPPEIAIGNIVCMHVELPAGQGGSAQTGSAKIGATVHRTRPPGRPVDPVITAGTQAVVVKKTYTNPARVQINLGVSARFRRSGTLTRTVTGAGGNIRLFTAAQGGTEINFDNTDNVFTGNSLNAGVRLFAESDRPSGSLNDIQLTLTLAAGPSPVGAPATLSLTAVALQLNISPPRLAPAPFQPLPQPPAIAPAPGTPAIDKWFGGVIVNQQDAGNNQARGQIIVAQVTPAAFAGDLVLRQVRVAGTNFTGLDNKLQLFDDEIPGPRRTPPATEQPKANPFEFNTSTVTAGTGRAFFFQGRTVSSAPRDTGFQLGIKNVENDGDRVSATVMGIVIQMINAANAVIPVQGDNACLMVSKFVTNVNLPDTATFDGPPGANPDPETFRVQIDGLPAGQTPHVRLEVLRGTATPYTHTFDMVQGAVGGRPIYRTNEHIRLVSNAVDDAHLAHQTPLVKLADIVRATLVFNNQDITSMQLPVGRPPDEDGPKAIRTVDIHFVTLQGVSSDPAATIERMNEDWAQLAIHFNLASEETRDPVKNVLTVDGTANADGRLSVDITPQAGAQVSVVAQISRGDTDEQIAQKLAAAISTHAGLTGSHHRHENIFIVLVNKGRAVTFANINTTVPSVVFQEPALNFTDEINLLEGSVLGLNFKDNDPSTIDMIAVGKVHVLGTSDAATGGDFLATNLPGWHNASIIREEGVDASDADQPFLAGHEMGHALFDGSNDIHSPIATNIFTQFQSGVDTINATKRLTEDQNTRARDRSGPNTVPPLLRKR